MSSFAGIAGIGHSKPYQGDAFAALSLGFANFVNGIVIRHPCVVIRRQCQVHDFAMRRHLVPTTLIPVIFKLSAKDGFLTLWKGAVGSGVLWAFSRVSELVLAELFGLPKTFIPDGSSQRFWRYIWLKASNFIFCTPVIVASFIETVRSGAGLADDLHLLEVITRGFERLSQDIFGTSMAEGARRRHSLLWLAVPTSFYQTVHFMICRYVYTKAFNWTRAYVSRKMPSDRKRYHTIMPELFSTMTSIFIADLACYPLETIIHRLYIQGTRTLVDNLDYGAGAFVPAGRYSGLIDCFTSIVKKEGVQALYSGIGAVFLQYMLQHGLAALVYWALDRGSRGYTSGPLKLTTTAKFPTADFPSAEIDSATIGPPPFSPFGGVHQNPSAQFAQSSGVRPSTSNSLLPTFEQTQQRAFEREQQQQNNPFLAAIRHQKSGFALGPTDNVDTSGSVASPYKNHDNLY